MELGADVLPNATDVMARAAIANIRETPQVFQQWDKICGRILLKWILGYKAVK
jgi:hypothetical protein